jgi:hypothetical protein
MGGHVFGAEPGSERGRRHFHELLFALESARSRLAVAIAAESKKTPRERWHHYLETEDRMRRCLREIRGHLARSNGRQQGWNQALSLLRQPMPGDRTVSGEAQRLCKHLSEVLSLIEKDGED